VPAVGPPRKAVCAGCIGGGLSGLVSLISDESALEVCIHDDAFSGPQRLLVVVRGLLVLVITQ